MIRNMAKEFKFGKMAPSMRVSGVMTKLTEKAG